MENTDQSNSNPNNLVTTILYDHGTDYQPYIMQYEKIRSKMDFVRFDSFKLNVVLSKKSILITLYDKLSEAGYTVFGGKDGSLIIFKENYVYVKFESHGFQEYTNTIYSCYYDLEENFAGFQETLRQIFEDKLHQEKTAVNIVWVQRSSQINNEEVLNDVLYDEAYPYITSRYGTLDKFYEEYLNSPVSILLIAGFPGTGKTRLIRGFLRYMNERIPPNLINTDQKDRNLKVGYTTDDEVLASGSFYLDYLRGNYDVLLLEDVDKSVTSRESGENPFMRMFLTTSDGIIQKPRGKIIVTTNMHISKIDTALMRHGRCFDYISAELLNDEQAIALSNKIGKGGRIPKRQVKQQSGGFGFGSAAEFEQAGYSVAEIYNQKDH